MTTKTDAAMECVVELANYMARDTTKGAAEQYSEMRDIILEHFPPSVPVSLLTRRHAEYSMEIAKYAQQNDQTGVDICVGKRNAIDRLITEARSHE